MNTANMNERDCLYQVVFSQTGVYPAADSNVLSLVRVLTQSSSGDTIPRISEMNELACYRALIVLVDATKEVADMNKLDCLRYLYTNAYSGTADVSQFNELSLLRGIVQLLYP